MTEAAISAEEAQRQSQAQLSREALGQKLEAALELFDSLASSYQKLSQTVEGRYQPLVEWLPIPLVVVDNSQVVIEANSAAKLWWGRELVGLGWGALSAQWQNTEVPEVFTDEQGRRLRLSSGSLARQETAHAVVDLTDTWALEMQLQQKQKLELMGEMAAGLAHQLRTPASVAVLEVSGLESEVSDKGQKSLQRLSRSLYRMEGLIQDMLSYVRSPDNERDYEQVALSTWLEHVVEHYHAPVPDIELVLASPLPEVSLKAAIGPLEGALSNLLDNAFLHSPAGGKVWLSAAVEGTKLRLCVRDQGVGVKAEWRPHLFTLFFSQRPGGTGLGLAVALKTAQEHGGTVFLDDSYQGGAQFVMELPCADSAATAL